jgi:hypothetical protein
MILAESRAGTGKSSPEVSPKGISKDRVNFELFDK